MVIGYGIYELVNDDNGDDGNTDQTLAGTDGSDLLSGAQGNDMISGAAGNDSIAGGSGNDTLSGDEGDDFIEGERGNDLIDGGADQDFVTGGGSDDVLLGQGGNDTLLGGDGNDIVVGGQDDDTLTGSGGKDWVEGSQGDDSVSGWFGFDTLIGGEGEDTLRGGNGGDLLFGGIIEGTPTDPQLLSQLRDGSSLAQIINAGADSSVTLVDDGDADILSGGDRNDTLFLGAGDIGAGDEGNDTFAILAAQATNPTQDFALIRDYSSTDDAIAVVVQDGSTPIITVTADSTDSIISIGETVLAHVTGAGSTLTAADVTIISSPTVGVLDPNT